MSEATSTSNHYHCLHLKAIQAQTHSTYSGNLSHTQSQHILEIYHKGQLKWPMAISNQRRHMTSQMKSCHIYSSQSHAIVHFCCNSQNSKSINFHVQRFHVNISTVGDLRPFYTWVASIHLDAQRIPSFGSFLMCTDCFYTSSLNVKEQWFM